MNRDQASFSFGEALQSAALAAVERLVGSEKELFGCQLDLRNGGILGCEF